MTTTCADAASISAFARGELDADELSSLDEHLIQCELCRQLVVLAASEERSSSPTDPPATPPRGATPRGATSFEAGGHIGRFELVRRLGAGASGTVFEALDPELDRRVAVKVLHGGAPELLNEGRALARLRHPNVVTVFDVLEVDETTIIVMELVGGQTLLRWVEREHPSPRDIATVFVSLAQGLAAVHDAGLLHRDVKPSNILVAPDGSPRVVDLGLAAAAQDISTPAGTPLYMAPELMMGGDATPLGDQFGLCVTLFESLWGERPFRGARLEELQAAIEQGPPALRGAVPGWLRRCVVRGLALAPEARFASMHAFASALERGLARRKRVLLGVALLPLGGLAVFASVNVSKAPLCTGATTYLEGIWDLDRQAETRAAFEDLDVDYAGPVWQRLDGALGDYAAAWVEMHTEACEATAVRGEQSSEAMDLRMACLQGALIEFGTTVDLLASVDSATLGRAHELTSGLPPLSQCVDVANLRVNSPTPRPEDEAQIAVVREELARTRVLRRAHALDRAEKSLARAEVMAAELDDPYLRIDLLMRRGDLLELRGEFVEAERTLRDVLQRALEHQAWDGIADASRYLLIVVGMRQNRFDEAMRYREVALGTSLGKPRKRAKALLALASIEDLRGSQAEAESLLHEALALVAEAPSAGIRDTAMSHLAILQSKQGRKEEAERTLLETIARRTEALGAGHPKVAVLFGNLGTIVGAQGRHAEARQMLTRALEVYTSAYGSDHFRTAYLHSSLGNVARMEGDKTAAEHHQRRALAIFEATFDAGHRTVTNTRRNLAMTLRELGKLGEAEAQSRTAVEALVGAGGGREVSVAKARITLAETLFARSKFEESEDEVRRILADAPKPEEETWRLPIVHATYLLGRTLGARGEHPAAEDAYRRALMRVGSDPELAAEICDDLAASLQLVDTKAPLPVQCAAPAPDLK